MCVACMYIGAPAVYVYGRIQMIDGWIDRKTDRLTDR
jgi:hypothetical protein